MDDFTVEGGGSAGGAGGGAGAKKWHGLLEKKWTSVIRLQKKVRREALTSVWIGFVSIKRGTFCRESANACMGLRRARIVFRRVRVGWDRGGKDLELSRLKRCLAGCFAQLSYPEQVFRTDICCLLQRFRSWSWKRGIPNWWRSQSRFFHFISHRGADCLWFRLSSAPSTSRSKASDAEWVPRGPAKHSLTGHRLPIVRREDNLLQL